MTGGEPKTRNVASPRRSRVRVKLRKVGGKFSGTPIVAKPPLTLVSRPSTSNAPPRTRTSWSRPVGCLDDNAGGRERLARACLGLRGFAAFWGTPVVIPMQSRGLPVTRTCPHLRTLFVFGWSRPVGSIKLYLVAITIWQRAVKKRPACAGCCEVDDNSNCVARAVGGHRRRTAN